MIRDTGAAVAGADHFKKITRRGVRSAGNGDSDHK